MNKKKIALSMVGFITVGVLASYGFSAINATELTKEQKTKIVKQNISDVDKIDKKHKQNGEPKTDSEKQQMDKEGEEMKSKMTEVENLSKDIDLGLPKVDEKEKFKEELANVLEECSLQIAAYKQHSDIKDAAEKVKYYENEITRINKFKKDFENNSKSVDDSRKELYNHGK